MGIDDAYEMRNWKDIEHAKKMKPMPPNMFDYFECPEFHNDLDHWEYLMQKYVFDSATLQINISSQMRQGILQMVGGADTTYLMRTCDEIRRELWHLLLDSYSRFSTSGEYLKLLRWGMSDKTIAPEVMDSD